MNIGDLVWYYPPYQIKRRLCVVMDFEYSGVVMTIYDFETNVLFSTTKSCIKMFDKSQGRVSG